MFFSFNDPSVRAIGRWAQLDMSYITAAAGSKLEIAFTGDMITLHFSLRNNEAPYPHLWLSVDGGARFEATLDHYIRVHCNSFNSHILTVVYKGGQESTARWFEPLVGKVQFLGYDADDSAVLPPCTKKTVEFVGDSITEGVLVDAHYSPILPHGQADRPYQDDVLGTYAAIAADELDLEPVFAGYGAVGATKSGCGNVPPAAEMYPYCYDGHPKTHKPCNFVVINHGTNDRGNPDIFCEKYRQLLDVIVKHNPNSNIVAMIPFIGAYREVIPNIVKEYNKTYGTDIFVVDASGWVPAEPLHPNRESHKIAGKRLAEILKQRYNL